MASFEFLLLVMTGGFAENCQCVGKKSSRMIRCPGAPSVQFSVDRNKQTRKDLDSTFNDIGEFGRYQKLIVYLVLLPAILPSGFHSYSQVFIAASPDNYWCRLPSLSNLSRTERLRAIPKDGDGALDRCFQYDAPDIADYAPDMTEDNFQPPSNWSLTPCQNGWEYDIRAVTSSVITEWDLVCDQQFSATLALILLSVGELVFAPIFGYISDRYGRKKPYFICLVLQLIFGTATAFSPNFTAFCVFRFIVGGTYGPMNLVIFVLALEVVGVEYRSTVAVLSALAFGIGSTMVGGVAWLVTDWFPFTLWTSVPFALYVLYWFVMPESPRWLLSEGRTSEVVAMMRTISTWNRKPQSDTYFIQLEKDLNDHAAEEKAKETQSAYSYFDLFRTPNIRKNVFLMTLINSVNLSVYTGLTYFGPTLSDENPHLSYFLLSVVEMPANLVIYLTAERIGRRIPLISGLVCGGVLCVIAVTIPEDQYWPYLIISLLAKLSITVTYGFAELVEGELFPTVVRNEGCAFTELVSSAVSTTVPVIVYLGYEHLSIPLAIFGGMAIFAGFAALWIPETLNMNLPDTIEDGENLGRNHHPLKGCFGFLKRKQFVLADTELVHTPGRY